MHPNNSSGFTLIELLVTIAIAAILLVVAAPSFRALIISNRVQGVSSEFQSALALARAEAVKRGGDARVTIVANSKTGTTPNWGSGLTVFFDTTANANGDLPPSNASTLIMKTGPFPDDVEVTANFNHVIYNGMGRTTNSNGAPLGGYIAVGASDTDYRCIVISLAGRARTAKISNAAYNAAGGGCPSL